MSVSVAVREQLAGHARSLPPAAEDQPPAVPVCFERAAVYSGMTSEIGIRRATSSDIEPVAALAGELVRQHHGVDPGRFFLPEQVEQGYAWWLRRELQRDAAVLLVAEGAGGVVGYCYGAMEERDFKALLDAHGAIHDVFVHESARRAGVGLRLVEAMLAELTARGAPRVVLSTMVSNEAAQRVFARCGFRPTMLEMTR